MQEIITSTFNDYFVTASWGARAETPQELAGRFFRMIDAFKQIDPLLAQWIYGRRTELETLRGDFAERIAKTIERDDFGAVTPNAGYWFAVSSPDSRSANLSLSVNCHVGSGLDRAFENHVALGESMTEASAPELHAYLIIHSALLAIVEAWDPFIVEANCGGLIDRMKIRSGKKNYVFAFRPAWMRYLCPALARDAKPPASAIVEYLPNGGMLLSATDQTFDVDTPGHVAVAEEIAAALAPLDQSLKSSSA